jgi:hypothetical protein
MVRPRRFAGPFLAWLEMVGAEVTVTRTDTA